MMIRRVVTRMLIWLNIVRQFRGLTIHAWLNMLTSALIEVLASFLVKLSNPKLWLKGLDFFFSKPLKAFFCVRGGTDDLYHLLMYREGAVQHTIEAVLRPNDVFVDVGANVGFYTVLAALRGARVISVEAVPHTAAVLRANIKLNGLNDRVKVADKCASNRRHKVRLYIPKSGHYGLATIDDSRFDSVHVVEVECVPLDEVLKDVERVRIVKIDVEGSELAVLKGLEKTLERIDYIIVEVSNREVISMLIRWGFEVRFLGFTTYILAFKECKGRSALRELGEENSTQREGRI